MRDAESRFAGITQYAGTGRLLLGGLRADSAAAPAAAGSGASSRRRSARGWPSSPRSLQPSSASALDRLGRLHAQRGQSRIRDRRDVRDDLRQPGRDRLPGRQQKSLRPRSDGEPRVAETLRLQQSLAGHRHSPGGKLPADRRTRLRHPRRCGRQHRALDLELHLLRQGRFISHTYGYDPTGTALPGFPLNPSGEAREACGVGVDNAGFIWVSDANHTAIQKYNSLGEGPLQTVSAVGGEGVVLRRHRPDQQRHLLRRLQRRRLSPHRRVRLRRP